jgi:acetyl esterase/lipase
MAASLVMPFVAMHGPVHAEMAKPTPEMQAVLDELKALKAQPVSKLDVKAARMQASPADAAMLVQIQKKDFSQTDAPVTSRDITIKTAAATLPARVYTPKGEGPFPVVLYFHGGGWVIADINTYDATPRTLAANTNAVVVSVDYRHAPENPFPAAHVDAWNAYEWLVENAGALNGDSKRIAVAGESAGGNLAANVALEAKARKSTMPVYQLLVYPVAGNDMETQSYKDNAEAVPLGRKDMEWFVSHVFRDKSQTSDPRLNLVGRNDLSGLPPATVVTAEIDPLRSEGEIFAKRLEEAGVKVKAETYKGVAHEFFGMGKVVPEAKEAMDLASSDLKAAFEATTKGN